MSLKVYVVDTGFAEYYTAARDEFEATEHAQAILGKIKYVEHFSDDLDDLPPQWEI